MAEGLLTIGTFSRASSLSIKMLRAYHEGGILVPARIDPRTGYRAYSVDQLADAAIIVRLRALDLPLEQVREVLRARDPELTRRILERHRADMELRLDETRRIVAELQSGVAPVTHTPVHVRDEPARDTVRVVGEVESDTFAGWLQSAFSRLDAVLAEAGVAATGPPGGLYAAEIVDDGPEPAEAFVPVEWPAALPFDGSMQVPQVTLGQVAAARVAVLVHAGGYDSVGDTYRTLGAWVARHAEPSGERVREHYVVGPREVDDPAAFRTEIAWPIVPEERRS